MRNLAAWGQRERLGSWRRRRRTAAVACPCSGAGLYGLLRAEAKLARRAIGETTGAPPDATGWYGRGRPGPAIKVALLGDSSAAGYGVERVTETPAPSWPAASRRAPTAACTCGSYAVVGARSSDLVGQIDRAVPTEPHVAVILIGANDVTHSVLPSQSVRHLSEAVRRLRDAGVEVVVGTCPDLGTVKPIAPRSSRSAAPGRPPRRRADDRGRRGGRSDRLVGLDPGARVRCRPGAPVRARRFHPSADGYRRMVDTLLPSTIAALGFAPEDEAEPEAYRGEGVLPVTTAAAEAVKTPGTEVDGTEVGGSRRGMRGLWVEMRHRRRTPTAATEVPTEDEDAADAPRSRARSRPRSPSAPRSHPDVRGTCQRAGSSRPRPLRQSVVRQSELKKARMRSRLV